MIDAALIALGLGFFALSIGYAIGVALTLYLIYALLRPEHL